MVKIYTLTDPRTGKIRYLGKTKQDLNKRYYSHVSQYRLKREKSHKNSWISGVLRDGYKPIMEVIDIVPEEDWILMEQYWISQLLSWGYNLTNMTKGGEGCSGGSGCLGYRHTEEAKRSISIKNSRPKSQQWKDNVKMAVRKAVAVPLIQKTKEGLVVKEHESLYTACLEVNLEGNSESTKKNIHACCKGRRKTAYGFIWEYKNAEVRDKELSR